MTSAVFSASEHSLFIASANSRIYEILIYPYSSQLFVDEASSSVDQQGRAQVSVGRAMGQVKSLSVEDVPVKMTSNNHVCHVYKGHT